MFTVPLSLLFNMKKNLSVTQNVCQALYIENLYVHSLNSRN